MFDVAHCFARSCVKCLFEEVLGELCVLSGVGRAGDGDTRFFVMLHQILGSS